MIHPLAYVHPDAKLGENVTVEPFAYIAGKVTIGDGCWIGPNAIVNDGAILGKECKIFSGAVVAGIPQDLKFRGEETTAVIGDRTMIRECATVNRGTAAKGTTIVGSDTLIMAYAHVGHDCVVGNHCILANNVSLAGEVEMDDWAILGGHTAIHQFCRIGKHAMTSGGTMVGKDIPPYIKVAHNPASYVGVNSIGLRRRGFTSEQIKAAQEGFKYYSQIPGDGTSYSELRETGMSQEEAHRLAVGIDELEPADGKETVSDPQKWREIADSNISEDKKLEALKRASNESQARKFQIAWDYGVDLEQYVEAMERLPEFDVDGNGNYNQEEVTAALNGMSDEKNNGLVLPDLSGGLVLPTAGEYGNRDKAVLWQLITNAKSAKNNPFDTEIGEEVLSAMEKYKEEGLILPDLNGSDGGLVLPKLESGLVLPPLG